MKTTVCCLVACLGLIFSDCKQTKSNSTTDTDENLKSRLKGVSLPKEEAKGDIEEFEMEVNNGGLNQYFINDGQNCFETLRELKETGKTKTANILQQAISLINPNRLSEENLKDKLYKREVEELFDDKISEELNKLDEEFNKYPDGPLTPSDKKTISR